MIYSWLSRCNTGVTSAGFYLAGFAKVEITRELSKSLFIFVWDSSLRLTPERNKNRLYITALGPKHDLCCNAKVGKPGRRLLHLVVSIDLFGSQIVRFVQWSILGLHIAFYL